MFMKIIRLIRERKVMNDAFNEAESMLVDSRELFRAAALALLEGEPVEFDLYARDREINRREVAIRRKLLTHAASSGVEDVAAVLILVSTIIDIERIGDFSKNLLDLSKKVKEPLPSDRYATQLRKTFEQICPQFDYAAKALLEGSTKDGQVVLEEYPEIAEETDALISELLKDKEITARSAIVYTLTARYFKRVASHLQTIASTSVNPFPLIGYRPDGEDDE